MPTQDVTMFASFTSNPLEKLMMRSRRIWFERFHTFSDLCFFLLTEFFVVRGRSKTHSFIEIEFFEFSVSLNQKSVWFSRIQLCWLFLFIQFSEVAEKYERYVIQFGEATCENTRRERRSDVPANGRRRRKNKYRLPIHHSAEGIHIRKDPRSKYQRKRSGNDDRDNR